MLHRLTNCTCLLISQLTTLAAVAVAQLAARRSHNPKVVSSILTCHIELRTARLQESF